MKKDSSSCVGSTILVGDREVSYDFSAFLKMEKSEAYEKAVKLVDWYVNCTQDGCVRSEIVSYILVDDKDVTLFCKPMNALVSGHKSDLVKLSVGMDRKFYFGVFRWNAVRNSYVKETRWVA